MAHAPLIGYDGSVYTANELAGALASSSESDYVRLIADWLARGDCDDEEPGLTGLPVADALTAAAVAYRCTASGRTAPAWTCRKNRVLDTFWHPSDDRFFAYSMSHTPTDFLIRGLLVEEGSLESV